MRLPGWPDVHAAGDAAYVAWPRALVERTDEGQLPLSDSAVRVPLWFQMRLWNQARAQGAYAARCMAGALDALEAGDGGLPFELFAHASVLLGRKVVLLGLFNGQGLGRAYEEALRSQVVVSSAGMTRGPSSGAGAGAEGGGAGAARPPAPALVAGGTAAASAAAASAAGAGAAHPPPPVQVQLRVSPGAEYVKLVLLHGRVVGALLVGDTDLEETMENLILNRIPVVSGGGVGADGLGHGSGVPLLDLLDPDVDIEDYFD
jgi:hypothetical protein